MNALLHRGHWLGLLSLGVITAAAPGCTPEKPVTCGTGTTLAEDTKQCLPDVDVGDGFNRVIDSVDLGKIQLSDLDVPDTMIVGKTYSRSFSITNTSSSSRAVTFVRIGMVDNLPNDGVQNYFTRIRGSGKACTDSCTSANDGVCKDTEASTSSSACTKGTDCSDCGPRKGVLKCSSSHTCSADGYECDRTSETCHLRETGIAAIYIENLAAGETRKISYTAALPPRWREASFSAPKTVQLFVSVNEVKLRKSGNDYLRQTSDLTIPGERNLEHAEGVALLPGTTKASKAESSNLQVLSKTALDKSSFKLDFSSGFDHPILTANTAVRSVGKDYGDSNTYARMTFTLKMPGHATLPTDYQVGDSVSYDADREFPLYALGRDGVSGAAIKYKAPCAISSKGCSASGLDISDKVSLEQGVVKTGAFKLFLRPEDVHTLAETLNLRSANRALNSDDELPGTVRIAIAKDDATEEPDSTDNYVDIPVVFQPPPANDKATANDANHPVSTNTSNPLTYGPYAEKDKMMPTLYQRFGGDWLGASYQLQLGSSKERLYRAVTKQYLSTDDYVKLYLLQEDFKVLAITGEADWGSQRQLSKDHVSADINVLGVSAAGLFSTANSLLTVDFNVANDCSTDSDGVETCMLLDEAQEPDGFGTVSVELVPNSVSVEETAKWEEETCDGPMCFTAAIELAGEVGLKGTIGLFRDAVNQTPAVFQGIQFTLGPYAQITGTASGELSVHLATIAIVGSVNLLSIDLTPTMQVGLLQDLDSSNGCWSKNKGAVTFSGPATLTSMDGDVRIQAYLGEIVDLGIAKINLRWLIYEYILFAWPAQVEKAWTLWSTGEEFLDGPGTCGYQPWNTTVFKSPIVCSSPSGGRSVCPNSMPAYSQTQTPSSYTGTYKTRLYTTGNQCGKIVLTGATEALRAYGSSSNAFGDAVGMKPGPGSYSDDLIVQINDHTDCIKEELISGAETTSNFNQAGRRKGRVGCGVIRHDETETHWWDDPDSSAWRSAVRGPFSGNFDQTEIRYCNTTGFDKLRWIDVWLNTDGAASRGTVTAKIVPDEGLRKSLRSDTNWWQTYALTGNAVSTWMNPDYDESSGTNLMAKAVIVSQPTRAVDPAVAAPFTQTDLDATKWIWGPPVCVGSACDDTAYGGSTRYFRRSFLASKDSYTIRYTCAQCTILVDGVGLSSYQWNGLIGNFDSRSFTIATKPGQLHTIGIMASMPQGLSGWQPQNKGVYFMMR